jgi:DNA-binding beta-propeller fold protein YncE
MVERSREGCHGARRAGSRLRRRGLLGAFSLLFAAACATGGGGPEEPVFYPGLPETPRIQYLASFSDEDDVVGKATAFDEYLLGPSEAPRLSKPYGVAIHQGKIFVCDTMGKGVVIFDVANRKIELLGTRQPGRLQKPINIAVGQDGTRYVTDTTLGRVLVYDADNRYRTAFGKPGSWSPTDVEVVGEDLYVTDIDNGQVVVIDTSTGEELRRLGRRGTEDAEFVFPTNLAIDDDGNVYVSDTGAYKIQKLDSRGRYLQHFGDLGDTLGHFARPKGIDVDREGRLYAVDAAYSNIQIFDSEGSLLLVFGGYGGGPGQMYLPAKVRIDYDNVDLLADRVAPGYEVEYLILVTNQYGPNKVSVYGFLRTPEEE